MSPNVPVTLFNANIVAVQVSVNGGKEIPINATGPSILYTPQRAATNPGFDYHTAAPNVLAPGDNWLAITPQGAPAPVVWELLLPRTQQFASLQIYIYWNSSFDVNWVVLDTGQFVASSLQ